MADDELEEDERAPREAYQMLEEDLLDVLVGAAEQADHKSVVIEIPREADKTFWFRIRVVPEEEEERIRKSCQRREKNKRFGGLRTIEDFDLTRFRSLMIVAMTEQFLKPVIGDDGQQEKDPVTGGLRWLEAPNMWENKALRERLKVSGKAQVVDKILLPGEKERVLEKHDELSGVDQDELEEQVKN